METTKIPKTEQHQTTRLNDCEAQSQCLGNTIDQTPDNVLWKTFLEGINSFSDDFFADGRCQGKPDVRH